MIKASRRTAWAALGMALTFHGLMLSLQLNRRLDPGFLRVWLLDSVAPFEQLVDRAALQVIGVWDGYINLVQTRRDNERLRQEIDSLRSQLVMQNEAVLEARRLRDLLMLDEQVLGRTVVARVVGKDPAVGFETVTIDVGRSRGVRQDTAVMTSLGVVGRVIHVGNSFAVVQLLTDSQSGIGILTKSTRRQGILRGNGSRELELDHIEDDNDIHVGDEIVTSGLDRIYPKGLPVGVVSDVGVRKSLLRSVRVRPAADLVHLEEVVCLLDSPSPAAATPFGPESND